MSLLGAGIDCPIILHYFVFMVVSIKSGETDHNGMSKESVVLTILKNRQRWCSVYIVLVFAFIVGGAKILVE